MRKNQPTKTSYALCNDCDKEFWGGGAILGMKDDDCPNGHDWCRTMIIRIEGHHGT